MVAIHIGICHLLQVTSLQGISWPPAARFEPSQAQAHFQHLAQVTAEALQDPLAAAASPSLASVLPACMTKQEQQKSLPLPQTEASATMTQPVPATHAAERPITWLAWEHQMVSEEPGPTCGHLADEYMHPHTQWVLDQPLAKYVLDPQPVVLKPVKQTASGGLGTGSAAASGSPSGDALGPTGDTEADTATQQASPDAHTPAPPDLFARTTDATQPNLYTVRSRGQLSRLGNETDNQQEREHQLDAQQGSATRLLAEQATPALSGFSASQPAVPDMPADSEPCTPAISAASEHLLGRHNSGTAAGPAKSSSRPLGRQRHSVNYNLLAGNRKTDLKSGSGVHKGGKKGLGKNSPVPPSEVRKDQAALAVAAAIAEGVLCATGLVSVMTTTRMW